MRVVLDTSTLLLRHAGIATYTLELVKAMLRRTQPEETLVAFDPLAGFVPIDHRWPAEMESRNTRRVATGRGFASSLPERVMRSGDALRRLARFAKEVRFALGARHHDLCHALATMPPGPTDRPVIPLLCDISPLLFPETHPRERVRAFERWLPAMLRAPAINTISEHSRREIASFLGYPRERILVTHPGVDHFFLEEEPPDDTGTPPRLALGDRPFLLVVGTREPRKNIPTALAAFARLPPAMRRDALLVVAGGDGWGSLALPREAEPLARDGTIRFPGYVERGELRALYRHARALVFPSLHEGFGMPVIEALACGTRVVISAGTALAEAAGPHGVAVQPGDVEGWSDAMREALEGEPDKPARRAERRDWARRFDWTRTASLTLGLYRRVLAGGPVAATASADAL